MDKTDLSYIQMGIIPFSQYTSFLSFFFQILENGIYYKPVLSRYLYIDGKFYGVNKYISEYSAIDVFSSSFREC